MRLSKICALLAIATLVPCETVDAGEADGYGDWMRRATDQWPKIAVVNQIDYDNKHHPVAGCGFLLEHEGKVVAATAKHVLTYFKSAKMDSVDFQGTLKSWKMFPKDGPTELVVLDKLINRDPKESLTGIPCGQDWLLFTIENRSKNIQPLRIRTTPLVSNEPIYLIGWRYTETDCPQVVYEGKFVRYEKDAVCITVEKLIKNTVPGLSGAPVIDSNGYLVGLMSRGKGEIQRASPVDYPRKLLKTQAESTSQ